DHVLGDQIRGRRIVDPGGGPIPYVWDEDVADFIMLALGSGARGAYNLVASDPVGPREMADEAGLKYTRGPRSLVIRLARLSPILAKTGLVRAVDSAWVEETSEGLVVSNEKARKELGWAPKFPTTRDVARRLGHTSQGRFDRRIAIFLRVLGAIAPRMP